MKPHHYSTTLTLEGFDMKIVEEIHEYNQVIFINLYYKQVLSVVEKAPEDLSSNYKTYLSNSLVKKYDHW